MGQRDMQDMGFANNGQISTPTFNHLHDNGVALEQYYVQPSCSPTRATFMTGACGTHAVHGVRELDKRSIECT
jgi:arylsulfatase A-like enzyme